MEEMIVVACGSSHDNVAAPLKKTAWLVYDSLLVYSKLCFHKRFAALAG